MRSPARIIQLYFPNKLNGFNFSPKYGAQEGSASRHHRVCFLRHEVEQHEND
jgi:hypothetical protein